MSRVTRILEQINPATSDETENKLKKTYVCPKCGLTINEVGPEGSDSDLICPHDGTKLKIKNDEVDNVDNTEESTRTLADRLREITEDSDVDNLNEPEDFMNRIQMALAGPNEKSDITIASSAFVDGDDLLVNIDVSPAMPELTPQMRIELADVFGSDPSRIAVESDMLSIPLPQDD